MRLQHVDQPSEGSEDGDGPQGLSPAPQGPIRPGLHDLRDRRTGSWQTAHPDRQAPLGVAHIAELLGVRRRYVQSLLADATFKTELAAAIAQMRQNYAAKAINRMAEIIDSPNEGVALRAAQAIIGDDPKAPLSTSA